MLKTVSETPQQNGVAKRMNRTLNERAKSMRLHVGLPKMFWEDSVTTAAYLINGGPTLRTFRVPNSRRGMDSKSHKVIRSRDVTFNEDSLYGAKAVTDSKITQSPVRSSDASEGSKNSGSFEDSGRSNEEDSKDKASSKKGGSETLYKEFVQWKKAINEEMVSLKKNQTWSLVRLPTGKKALQSKWVFRVKEEQDGKKRLVLSIIAAENLHLEQLDVKTAFLHGDLYEDIYMTQLEGFQSAGKEENLVCKLKKSLYGLKCQPLGDNLKLSKKQSPKTEASRRRMAKVPYASAVGSVMKGALRSCQLAVTLPERFGQEYYRLCFHNGWTAVSWMSRIQKCVAMSTTEAEYMAIAEAVKELVWLKNFLEELDRAQTESVLFCDNQSAIHLTKNQVFHEDSWSKEPCRYAHQGGDDREVEAQLQLAFEITDER
ncbi:retrovirus-related pol polyprotein from transposon TNT 1-94, partial [Tanacetum coccineum]